MTPPDGTLTVGVEHLAEGQVLATVAGELDYGNADRLTDRLGPETGPGRMLLDLGGLEFCDSIGLNAIVRLWKRMHEAGGELVVVRTSPLLTELMEITGLAELLGAR
ncbi:STAS domain-containing protein [Actinomadura parmotrematis]|uniref:Anti-sigma factor antagonist n=1 Tax=Actinomadura parmotrematis TaxID=2864039 RepID=A0ABS7FZN0_9ACTN|nr:STAS domain-containing protein [Actinomadura parmotrematis]MBW8485908.1 STAS domain-containing protein [Actinomadura parmotrematis]